MNILERLCYYLLTCSERTLPRLNYIRAAGIRILDPTFHSSFGAENVGKLRHSAFFVVFRIPWKGTNDMFVQPISNVVRKGRVESGQVLTKLLNDDVCIVVRLQGRIGLLIVTLDLFKLRIKDGQIYLVVPLKLRVHSMRESKCE